jgi:hypothetical protein
MLLERASFLSFSSNLEARVAALLEDGRTVVLVDEDTCLNRGGTSLEGEICLVGELGGSGVLVVPRVLSQDGGFAEALLVVD